MPFFFVVRLAPAGITLSIPYVQNFYHMALSGVAREKGGWWGAGVQRKKEISFMKRIVIFGLLLVVALLGLTFALMNADTVHLSFYFTEVEAPLSLVVVLAMILGAALGVLASLGIVVAQKRELGRLRRSVKLAEAEVSNLRALPLKDSH